MICGGYSQPREITSEDIDIFNEIKPELAEHTEFQGDIESIRKYLYIIYVL